MDVRERTFGAKLCRVLFLSGLFLLATIPVALKAQTAGEGTISGTVTDTTGAAIPNATITATNVGTNVSTVRTSSGSGVFTIAPVLPGTYTVTVAASGFETLKQDNVVVDALAVRTINPVLSVGETAQTVVVTGAPPVLNTANATLGLTIENNTYSNLPIQMNGAQRDPTAFGALAPGAWGGTRLPVIAGTGNYLGQLYLDGMPAETISQQGDNRPVSLTMDLDAVDQMQVVTSTPPAEYSGAGAENFTMKSGTLHYHGQASDFVRNTIFDTWSFASKAATTTNAAGQVVPAPKPIEHQNELSLSVGGKVPHTADKLFFFVAYDKFHYRKGVNPSFYTIPTTAMQGGDFTQLAGTNNAPFLFDPTTTACVGNSCSRQPLQGMKNGVPTNNVIPSGYLSPIAQKMQSFLPAPTNSSVINNWFGGQPAGFDNHVTDYRVDYDLSSRNRISAVGAIGVENYVNNFGAPLLPLPYTGGDLANIYPKTYDVEDAYTITPRMTNQLKYGYTRFFQNIHDSTQGVTAWEPAALGITNLPAGQAGEEFPGASFPTTPYFSSGLTAWTSNGNSASTQLTTPNNYTLLDNLQWLKGRHSLTFGTVFQWQEINNANPATYTGVLPLTYSADATAQFVGNAISTGVAPNPATNSSGTPSGYSYASFLLGAVSGTPSIGLDPVSELGGRYKTVSPYVEDNWKVTSKLTLDLGIRWDYLPPFHEVKDRWTFMNPNLTNTATGTPGMLQFAGSYGGPGVSCGCKTPVHTYYKNWGPRIGLTFSPNAKTVFRVGYGMVYTQAGGVGGRGGAYNGTGQTGFNVTAIGPSEITTGPTTGPSFYLNNSSYFSSIGLANTGLFGPGFTYPANPTPSAASQILNTGYYLNSSGSFVTASGVSYADPYYSGRAPQLNFYNAGIERAITPDMTLAVNYAGDESHFIINSGVTGGAARGYWNNQLNPVYLVGLGGINVGGASILTQPATPANVAIAQAAMPGINIPAFFQNAATVNKSATIAQGLVAFPQYSGVSDAWGNVSNFSYNALQITLQQRPAHGLTFNLNYTFAKNLGDDGTFRNGFNIPADAVSRNTVNWKQNRIDRSWTADNLPQVVHIFGVYQLPFGKGGLGGNSFLVRSLAGGWQFSGIYSYSSGTPIAVTSSVCSGTNFPGAEGTCMPDLNPAYSRNSARINGSYGSGPNGITAANFGHVLYLDSTAFTTPQTLSNGVYLIGNAPRTRALNLNNPGTQELDAGLRRSFPIHESMGIVIEADCFNVQNKVTMNSPSATWAPGSATFGEITGASANSRDWQFAGHFNF